MGIFDDDYIGDDFIISEVIERDKTMFPVSRYRKEKKLKMKTGLLTNETMRGRVVRESDEDRFHVVTSGEVNRIDLISFRYFNDVRLWWVIAAANNLIDPMDLEPGTVLRIPSMGALYGRAGILT